jgi:uncharacterized protein (TIGR02186 family)
MKIPGRQKIVSSMKVVSFIAISLFIVSGHASAELTAKANHDHITIDFFYHGSTVSVSGTADPGTDLIIMLTSPEGHQALKQKGKVGGVLWMNVGTLNFEHTPNLYLVRSTRKIDDILRTDEMEKYAIGYPALKMHTEITPVSNGQEKDQWFNEFVKFKESSNLYGTSYGNISTTLKDGKQNYYTLFEWPYQAPPGDYVATVYAVRDGQIFEAAEAKVLVEQVGAVKALSTMAKNNGALYGIISIMAALGAGFGVGLIFRKGGGSH